MTSACLMVLGFCLPGPGTPVSALVRDGFHVITNEGERLPPGQRPGEMQTLATVKRSRNGAKAWVGVVSRGKRATLIAVSCLGKKGAASDTRALARDPACQTGETPGSFVCGVHDKRIAGSHCGNHAFVVTGGKDEDREKTCDLLRASKEAQ